MPTQADIRFAQAAMKLGFLTRDVAQAVLEAQKAAEDTSGGKLAFKDLALRKKALTAEQIRAVEEGMGLRGKSNEKQLGPYLVQKKIGQGGMGAVYLALDTRDNRLVALKVLVPSLTSDPIFIQRFEREARVASVIDHPKVVKCYETGQEQNFRYMALEYVEGGDVLSLLKEGPLSEPKATQIALDVAEGLAAAHAASILHRDIKPQNILIHKDGSAKLADLGLARAEDDSTITQMGMVVGTPHYMSPEQALNNKDVDMRSDIYAFGATLYHMVCGKPPFEGATAVVVLEMHLKSQIPSPKEVVPGLSDGICHIIAKCMAKKKEGRYQTTADLLEDLQRVQNGQEPASEVLDPGDSTIRMLSIKKIVEARKEKKLKGAAPGTRRRSPLAKALGVIALTLASCLGAWLLFFNSHPPVKSGHEEASPVKKPVVLDSQQKANSQRLKDLYANVLKYAQENPEQYTLIIEKLNAFESEAQGTPWVPRAQEERKKVETRLKERASQTLENIQKQMINLTSRDALAEAFRLLESFPDHLMPGLPKDKLPELRKFLEAQAIQWFQRETREAEELVKNEKFAEARALYQRVDALRFPFLLELVKLKIQEIQELESAAVEREKGNLEKEYEKIFVEVVALARDRKYELALRALDELARQDKYKPLSDRMPHDRSEIQGLKTVWDRAMAALPGMVGKPFSIKGIQGTLKEVQGGRLVFSTGEHEFSHLVQALKTKEIADLYISTPPGPGPDQELALALLWMFSDEKNSQEVARLHLNQARDKGMEIARHEEFFEWVTQLLREAEAKALFDKASQWAAKKEWKSAQSAFEELGENYSDTAFVIENSEKIDEILTQSAEMLADLPSTLKEGLVLWLSADKEITKDAGGRVSRWEDLSGKGNHAVQEQLANRPQWKVDIGGEKAALEFDGVDDWLAVPSLTGKFQAFSVIFTIYPKSRKNYNQTIGPDWGQFIFQTENLGSAYVGTHLSSRMAPGVGQSKIPPDTVALDQWQQFAFVFGQMAGSFYKNGHFLASNPMPPPDEWKGFQLGRNQENLTLHGSLKSIRIYNRALTEKEVFALAGKSFQKAPKDSEGLKVHLLKEDFRAFDPKDYFLDGNAHWDRKNRCLVLTEAKMGQRGRMFFKTPFPIQAFAASFEIRIGGGAGPQGGADGITFAFVRRYDYPGGAGETLDFGGDGYGVEFDTFINAWDPKAHHIALLQKSVTQQLSTVTIPGGLRDDRWHRVLMSFKNGRLSLKFDGKPIFSDFKILDYKPFKGFFGFTAATGGACEWHGVRNIQIKILPER